MQWNQQMTALLLKLCAITHIQLAFDTPDFHKLTHTWLSTTLVKKQTLCQHSHSYVNCMEKKKKAGVQCEACHNTAFCRTNVCLEVITHNHMYHLSYICIYDHNNDNRAYPILWSIILTSLLSVCTIDAYCYCHLPTAALHHTNRLVCFACFCTWEMQK